MLTKNGIISENITGRYARQSDLERAREALRRAVDYEEARLDQNKDDMPPHEYEAEKRNIVRMRATIQ